MTKDKRGARATRWKVFALTLLRDGRRVELFNLVLVRTVALASIDAVPVPTLDVDNVLVEEVEHRDELRKDEHLEKKRNSMKVSLASIFPTERAKKDPVGFFFTL